MIILIFFSIYLIIFSKNKSIASYLAAFVILSIFSGFILGLKIRIDSTLDIINSIYTSIILFLLIHAFKNHVKISDIRNDFNLTWFIRVEKLIIFFGLTAFLINAYIVFNSIGLIFSQEIRIEEYKNQGEAASYLASWLPSYITTLARFMSPLGYLAMGLHFYYLSKNHVFKGIIFFLISLNLPLIGLHGLSRSASVLYILLYLIFYIYIRDSIDKKIRKKYNRASIIIVLIVLIPVFLISNYRFEKYYNIPPESKIDNPLIYSTLHYFSQWTENGIAVSRNYSSDKVLFGKTSAPLVFFIARRIDSNIESISEARLKAIGFNYSNRFNGIAATFLYEFGYLFSILFTLFFYLITRRTAPDNHKVSLSSIMWFGILVSLPLTFFGNNHLSDLMFSISILYTILFNSFLRKRGLVKNLNL